MSELRDLFVPGATRLPATPSEPAAEEAPAPAASQAQLIKVMAAIVLAATVAAFLASNAKQRVYGARIELLYSSEAYDSESEFNRALATQREILRSEPVLGAAASAAGMTTAKLQKALDVETVGESEVLRVTVGNPSRDRAKALAQAVVDNYLERVARVPADDASNATTSFLRARIDELTAELDRTTARHRELETARGGVGAPGAEESRLREEAAELVRRIGALRDRLVTVEVRRTTSSDVRVLAPARVLKDPIEPKPKQAAVAGFLIGSVLAAATAYLLRYLPEKRVEKVDRPDVF